jgi:hypothetical protein
VAVDDTNGDLTRLALRWEPVSARLDKRIINPDEGKVGLAPGGATTRGGCVVCDSCVIFKGTLNHEP